MVSFRAGTFRKSQAHVRCEVMCTFMSISAIAKAFLELIPLAKEGYGCQGGLNPLLLNFLSVRHLKGSLWANMKVKTLT